LFDAEKYLESKLIKVIWSTYQFLVNLKRSKERE